MAEIYSLQFKELGEDGDINKTNINDWVSSATKGLINDFFKDPVKDPLVLLNTCYFKAPWNEKNIKGQRMFFNNLDGSKKDVDGFVLSSGTAFRQGGYEVGRAHYGNMAYQLTIVMSESGKLPVASEVAEKWTEWKDRGTTAVLTFPEWDVESFLELNNTLNIMGMGQMFRSPLINVADNAPAINQVNHAVRMITNKKGTEAAAVTVGIVNSAGDPLEVVELKVDRPFLYVISESSTGAILFIGEVTKL